MSIYDDLCNCASTGKTFDPIAEGESDNDYLCRLAQAISQSTKDAFELMPADAQAWFDKAADALNAAEELPLPVGFRSPPEPPRMMIRRPTATAPVAVAPEPEPEPEPEPPEPEDEPEDEPEPEPAEDEDEPVAAAPVEPEPAPKTPRTRRRLVSQPQGVSKMVRQFVIENQEASIGDIIDGLLKQKRVDMTERRNTVSTLRYDTLVTLGLLKELGWGPKGRQDAHR